MSARLPIISTWDPRATSSGSIDPLGALRAYNAVATFFLPGVTTVTTRARYLSWVCAGLRLLDETPDAPRGGQSGRARRQRLLPWERLIVLSTGLFATEAKAPADDPAWRELRGISYVRRAIAERKCSVDYELLKNQASVGGVGSYWVTLVNGGLVDDASAELTHRGIELADAFLHQSHAPPRELLRSVVNGRPPKKFDVETLKKWGEGISLNLAKASARERSLLADALLEPQAHRRLEAALRRSKLAKSNRDSFVFLHKRLLEQRDPVATQLAAVVAVTQAFEAVHAGLLDRFDRLRGSARQLTRDAAALLVGEPGDLAGRGIAMQGALASNAGALPRTVSSAMREFHMAVQPALDSSSGAVLVTEMTRHHERVQAGKLDASRQPKHSWISMQDRSLIVSPRFSLEQMPTARNEDAFTHPYRVESFTGMLTEVGAWGKDR